MRKNQYSTSFYEFTTTYFEDSLLLYMKVSSPFVKTRFLPQTHAFLKQHAPAVLTTTCFNDKNLPFSEEVKDTEFGHLFEHILIQYLYLLKTAAGETNIVCNGRTNWDWKTNPFGSFLITVQTNKTDVLLFRLALEKTICVCNRLLSSHQKPSHLSSLSQNA